MRWCRHVAALALVDQRLFWRNRSLVMSTFVVPVALAVGVPVMAHAGRSSGATGFAASFLTGMLALVVVYSVFLSLVVSITARRDQLVLKRLRATELSDSAIFAGEVLNATVLCLAQAAAVVLAGRAVLGIRLPVSPVALAALVVAGCAVFGFLAIAYTAVVPSAEVAPVMGLPVLFAAFLAAGVFGPVAALPAVVRGPVGLIPLAPIATGIREAYFGRGDLAVLPAACLLLAWLAAGAALSVRFFRWDPRRG